MLRQIEHRGSQTLDCDGAILCAVVASQVTRAREGEAEGSGGSILTKQDLFTHLSLQRLCRDSKSSGVHFLNFLNGLREPMFEWDLDNLQHHLSLLTCESNYKLQIAVSATFWLADGWRRIYDAHL